MSIFKVNQTDFQSTTVALNPSRYYSSSSSGVTGSLRIFSRKSFVEKDIELEDNPSTSFDESSLFNSWNSLKSSAKSKKNIFNLVSESLDLSNKAPLSLKKQKTLDIVRFTPTEYFSTGTVAKLQIKDNLSNYYRTSYPSANWGYYNYHSLNFFSSSTVSTSSVLLYPNSSNVYARFDQFSFDFYINPRYNALDSNGHFKAGTIFHLSSSYALSLISGSEKDHLGRPSSFRLQLQLKSRANIAPSLANPTDLLYLSEDNSLKLNNWHHVVVRWGTSRINNGSGSFNIDGVDKGFFVIPSSSLQFTSNFSPALCIGNYYEGTNSGNDSLDRFFGDIPARNEGVYRLNSLNVNAPDNFSFAHPLQAEVHDLSIKKYYMSNADIAFSSSKGVNFQTLRSGRIAFYVPPFFMVNSVYLDSQTKKSGMPYTPSIAVRGMPVTPFNVPMAFGTDGHYINTDNFLRDLVTKLQPRQLFLSATLVDTLSNAGKTANEILYSQPSVIKRNLMILPCDDGNFIPDYSVMSTGSFSFLRHTDNSEASLKSSQLDLIKKTFFDDLKNTNLAWINLNEMCTGTFGSAINTHYVFENQGFSDSFTEAEKKENAYIDDQQGFSSRNPTADDKGETLNKLNKLKSLSSSTNIIDVIKTQQEFPFSISYKTQDSSSNQVVFFDISNLFYGTRILPGSFSITDFNLSGSGGSIKITIKDDGNGGLYRADSLTKHSTWNSIGTIFYNEGIIAIKSPHLYFFGKNQYEMSFKGEQNMHVLRLEAIAPQNYLNSSSNPSYRSVPSTNNPNEPDSSFVYITGINFHDDNLNVVMKTQLAQPIMKRHSEKILFKVKYDF